VAFSLFMEDRRSPMLVFVVPAGLLGLVLVVLLIMKVYPWIKWKLHKPTITTSLDSIQVNYHVKPELLKRSQSSLSFQSNNGIVFELQKKHRVDFETVQSNATVVIGLPPSY
jgi:hypothetical protein